MNIRHEWTGTGSSSCSNLAQWHLQLSLMCDSWHLTADCSRTSLHVCVCVTSWPAAMYARRSELILKMKIKWPLGFSITTRVECFLFTSFRSITGWSKTGCRRQTTWRRRWISPTPRGHQTCTSAAWECSYNKLCNGHHPNRHSGSGNETEEDSHQSNV